MEQRPTDELEDDRPDDRRVTRSTRTIDSLSEPVPAEQQTADVLDDLRSDRF